MGEFTIRSWEREGQINLPDHNSSICVGEYAIDKFKLNLCGICEQSFFGGWYRIDKYLENLRKIPMLDIRKKVKILRHTAYL